MAKRIPTEVRKTAKPVLDSILELAARVPEKHRATYLEEVKQLAVVHATPYTGSKISQQDQTQFGEAYWIFNSFEDPQKIRTVLPRVREEANVSPRLELTLLEGYDSVPNDADLRERAELQLNNVESDGPLYTLKVRLPEADNRRTLSELGKIVCIILDNQGLFRIGASDDLYIKLMGRYLDGSEV